MRHPRQHGAAAHESAGAGNTQRAARRGPVLRGWRGYRHRGLHGCDSDGDRRPAGRGPVHTLHSHFTVELPSTEPEPNLIAFRAGRGDGAYPVWIGRTDDGQVGCVVFDFQLPSADGRE
ncbi:DUF4241 domain-containing protein [Streptomyces sp. NPDC002574]|uniref:DUF4241 domain-containing protein n=1 Tax=Streptomyces sp. NPDC002574 TaxID=3364652 RepID=UPI0036B7F5A0